MSKFSKNLIVVFRYFKINVKMASEEVNSIYFLFLLEISIFSSWLFVLALCNLG